MYLCKRVSNCEDASGSVSFPIDPSLRLQSTFSNTLFCASTDNGTKNRFHHLRRRLDKDQSKIKQYSSILPQKEDREESATFEQKTRKVLKILSVESEATSCLARNRMNIKGYDFGPFVPVDKATMCKRCGLFVPSRQTGRSMCAKSQWCEACTMIPPYVQHDLLRECLGMRGLDSSGE